MSNDSESADVKINFIPKKRKNLRQRNISDDEDEVTDNTQDTIEKLAETKERQKLRNKPNGVNIIGLALGKKVTIEQEITNRDPFNTKSGGMINMHALKKGIKPVEDAYDVGIGTQFSAETNKRDEDEEMMKYIEDQLSKRKGIKSSSADDAMENSHKYLTPEEAALLALPDHLRLGNTQKSEEMLSNQMLNGIPEVDLGIEAKIKNIEATEAAKEKLLLDQKNKKDGPSQFVPNNMAVNFVQHNRFNIEEAESKKRKQNALHEREDAQQTKDKGVKKATDDYHYDKFKKQFRRY
ncbi:Telomere length and silencing protein 1 like [Pseudolycoriella hygida]|uniref:Telomere length and silencing protein 1 like n=1 Tax=Pseudolycoriella hygida TaxID=35572 RepID=A0A9Q0N4S2_9DIPT|nr:Telomere length and silencing protein 1 like [Pseudolycoriella hygida]